MMIDRLEEMCFAHILRTLEEFPANSLALLPANIRSHMLSKLPIVDVCHLEKTQFASGLDMNSIWKQLYEERKDANSFISKQPDDWKECFLSSISNTIFGDNRPYGYFQLMTRADKGCPWVAREITDDRPVHKHPVDPVNYLVAIDCLRTAPEEKTSNIADSSGDEDEEEKWLRRKYGPTYVVMKRHEVTLHKGIVPPASLYHKACQTRQLIPKRYAHCFAEGSSFLPDSVAITLLGKECDFCPKNLSISTPEFNTFLLNARHETDNFGFLEDYFKEIVSLGVRGDIEKNLKWKASPKSENTNLKGSEPRQIPSKVLGFVLSNHNPKLSTLHISIGRTRDQLLLSITPQLTSSFSGLRELSIEARGSVSPNLEKLFTITNHHPQLQSVSISITEITQMFGSFGPIVKNTPEYSKSLLLSLVELCFKKPSLCHLKLTLSPITAEYLQKILIAFLSAPCCSDQTLTLGFSLTDSKSITSSLPPRPFDNTCTLRHKSLVFASRIPPSFAAWLFSFQAFKLKQLVIKDHHVLESAVFSHLAQKKGFDAESIKITSMSLREATVSDFIPLLEKPSLKSLRFENCSGLNLSALASGLVGQRYLGTLTELQLCYDGYMRDEMEKFEDSSRVRNMFNALFSLPQLPQFSLTLSVAFSQKQLEMLYTEWKRGGGVEMKALCLSVPNTALSSSLRMELTKLATSVAIDTYTPKAP